MHNDDWYMNDRNRFNPGNRFIGDIEDGKRYPFGIYKKEECDEKFAVKQTEADLAALTQVVNTKAAQASLENLSLTVATKADEAECIDIRARLDALEYKKINIISYVAVPEICELGSTNDINLAWQLDKEAVSQEINGTTVTGYSKQYTGVVAPTTYVLTVSDGKTIDSQTVTISFANQIYYGAAADISSILELDRVLSNEKERTITVNAGAGEYIIYALPARLGSVIFVVGGFEGGFEDPVEQVITNESGYQEVYYIYRSTNANLGETTINIM